ncbi:hypothetical protein GGQ02_003119 [Salinibacter ruber]|nr:DUF6625 family protein [Salinibacter ruber]MCS4034709.1 hypothetical protein [Salinibacter ruber]
MTLDDVRQRARERLGLEPGIAVPYNLCDFKPTYGILFEDYLDEYDFWGCTDLDIVYGNIRSFVDKQVLKKNDVISARKNYLSGFFFLFENKSSINELYKCSEDYDKVLKSKNHFSFCECNFEWEKLHKGKKITSVKTNIESMTEVIEKKESSNEIDVLFSEIAREKIGFRPILWSEGKVVEGKKEWMLVHFVNIESKSYFEFPEWKKTPNKFYIYKHGFWNTENRLGFLLEIEWRKIFLSISESIKDKIMQRINYG